MKYYKKRITPLKQIYNTLKNKHGNIPSPTRYLISLGYESTVKKEFAWFLDRFLGEYKVVEEL